jgi:hypothetical protein
VFGWMFDRRFSGSPERTRLGKRCSQPLIGDGFPKLEMSFALKFIISIIMSDGYLKLFILLNIKFTADGFRRPGTYLDVLPYSAISPSNQANLYPIRSDRRPVPRQRRRTASTLPRLSSPYHPAITGLSAEDQTPLRRSRV